MISELLAPWLATKTIAKPGAFLIALDSFNEPLAYQLKVHKRRKNLSIEIVAGQVIVKTPPRFRQDLVESFLIQQQQWLKDKLEVVCPEHLSEHPNKQQGRPRNFIRQYKHGEPIWFLGEEVHLHINRASQSFWDFDSSSHQLTITLSRRVKNTQFKTRQLLHDFYLTQAKLLIPKLVVNLEQKTDLKSASVEFKFYQWRWGCCYSSGKMKFNPLLMAAPKTMIECVVIHELCHLKHMNHSKAFWDLNKVHCDMCCDTKKWLKEQHGLIYLPPI